MPQLDNPRHEKFAQAVAKGLKATAAYRKVYGNEVSGARQMGSALLAKLDIKERVKELQAQAANGAVLTLAEKRSYLRRVVTTAIGEVDESSDLCQAAEYSETGRKLKMPDKLRAIELDAKLSGELRERVEIDASDDFANFLSTLRAGENDRWLKSAQ